MAATNKVSSFLSKALHLWVCDASGGIHVLCHVNVPEDNPSHSMTWREVEENSDYYKVVGGASDVILTVDSSDSELFVRDKVSFSEPLGKKWLPTGCHVTHVAVGNHYIAVLTLDGQALIGTVSIVRGSHFCPIKWEEISDPVPQDLAYITMTTDDILYGITGGGVVYGCYGICQLARPLNWEFLSKPPVPARKGFLSSLFGATPSTIFDHVTSNEKGVWCYSKRNSEIWLLNIYEKSSKIRSTNWSRFVLPNSAPKLISITCDPCGTSLYGISEDGCGLYELIPAGNKIDISELPFHGYGDITMTTVTCSLLTEKEDDKKVEKTTPSLYPKLPKLDSLEKGLCCENGTCAFCLGRPSLSTVSTETTSTWEYTNVISTPTILTSTTGYTKDLYTIDNYRSQLKAFRRGQRGHTPPEEGETKKAKESNNFSNSPRKATPTAARKKRRSYSVTHRFIRDIPVTVTTPTSLERVIPEKINVSLPSLDNIRDKFVYSFELEESILELPLPSIIHPSSPSLSHSPSLQPQLIPSLSFQSPSHEPFPLSSSPSRYPRIPPSSSPLPINQEHIPIDQQQTHSHTPSPRPCNETHSQIASPESEEKGNSQLVIGFEKYDTKYITARSH